MKEVDLSNPDVVRYVVKRFGLRMNKKLGQNFLIRHAVVDDIADAAEIGEGDPVLEIGPGIGTLTQALAETGAAVTAVELDDHLLPVLDKTLEHYDNVRVVHGDILRIDIEEVMNHQPFTVCANLPYYITTPIIMKLLEQKLPIKRIVVMVQKEVGQRLAAAPGNGHYGALSVWVQSYTRPRLEFVVGPGAFSPPPKVDSAVLSFEPLPPEALPARPEALSRLLRICFQQRRKQLGGIFRRAGLPELETALERTGLAPNLRPEALGKDDFQRLAAFLPPNLDNPGQKRLS